MVKIEQTAEELALVAAAIKHRCLAETCILEDYHPDHGQVVPYWKPTWATMYVAREMSKFYNSNEDDTSKTIEQLKQDANKAWSALNAAHVSIYNRINSPCV